MFTPKLTLNNTVINNIIYTESALDIRCPWRDCGLAPPTATLHALLIKTHQHMNKHTVE